MSDPSSLAVVGTVPAGTERLARLDRPPVEFRQLMTPRGYEGVYSWFRGDERLCDHEHNEDEDWYCDEARATASRLAPIECCPRCASPRPGSHPAMQAGGEVQPCPHPWHDGQRFPVGVVALTEPCETCEGTGLAAYSFESRHFSCRGCDRSGRVVSGYALSGDDGSLRPCEPPEAAPAIGEHPLPEWPTLKGTT